MKTKTHVKAGGFAMNHNEKLNSASAIKMKVLTTVNGVGLQLSHSARLNCALALTALGILAAPPQALRADDLIFGQITGLQCQGAKDPTFLGFAVSTFTVAATHSGNAAGPLIFPDITLVKGLDDCTLALFAAVARGNVFSNAIFTVVPKGGKSPVLLIELQNVLLTGDTFTDSGKERNELVSVSYQKIKITHIPNGSGGRILEFSFDVGNRNQR